MAKYVLLCLGAWLLCSGTLAQTGSKKERRTLWHMDSGQRSPGSFTYLFETTTEPYEDLTDAISLNNGEIWDDPIYMLPIDFPFFINGTEVSSLSINGVGALLVSEFDASNNSEVVFPFEADLTDRGFLTGTSESPISYKVEGEPGSRILKMEWKNAGSYEEMVSTGTNDMFINIQMWLFEGSNAIEYHYGPSSITDPDLFYSGETGAIVGVSTANFIDLILFNEHFLTGPASDPVLTELVDDETPVFLDGTPADGTVYRFFLGTSALEVVVEGTDGTCGLPNGTATAIASGGNEPYTYLWSNGETTSSITDLPAGVYSVTVTDDSGTTATAEIEIANVAPVVANAFATDETGPGLNDGTAGAAPMGGTPPYTFEWNTGDTTGIIVNLAPGSYTVTVTDVNGCTDWQTVEVNAFVDCPDLQIIFDFFGVNCPGECQAGIEILDVENATLPVTYVWSEGSTTSTLSGLCAGTYHVTVTDTEGCTATQAFDISDLPPVVLTTGHTDETAEDANDGTAWVMPEGGDEPYAYLWSTGATDSLITDLAPGIYHVTVTDANGCTAAASVLINAFGCNLLFEATITQTCGICVGSITLTEISGTPPYNFLWSTGTTTEAIFDLCSGTYWVEVTDANGCFFTETYILPEMDSLILVTGSTDETAPEAADGTAWVTPLGGVAPYSYQWSTGDTDSLITALPPGTYSVVVTDVNGCEAEAEITIHEFECFELAEFFLMEISCFGACDGSVGIVPVGGGGPFQYSWSTGDTTDTVAGLCAGTYSVTVADMSQGCEGTAEFTLTEPELLNFNLDTVIHVMDSTAGAIHITLSGGIPPYQYAWSGPAGFSSEDEDISGLEAGVYHLLVTDANGCQINTDSVTILDFSVGVQDLPQIHVVVYPNPAQDKVRLALEDGTSFEVILTDGTGRVIHAWHNATELDVRDVPAGLYLLRVTSDNGVFAGRLIIIRQ